MTLFPKGEIFYKCECKYVYIPHISILADVLLAANILTFSFILRTIRHDIVSFQTLLFLIAGTPFKKKPLQGTAHFLQVTTHVLNLFVDTKNVK